MKTQVLVDCLRTAVKHNDTHPERHKNGFHHFSFIIHNNSIISCGYNRGEGTSALYGYKPYQKLHSENTAYFKAKGLLRGDSFEIVNVRLTRTGIIKISKPCRCCLNFLVNLGCTAVWFTTGCDEYQWAKLSIRR